MQSNAGSVPGVPHNRGDSEGVKADKNKDANLLDATSTSRLGGVNEIPAGETYQALPPVRYPVVSAAGYLAIHGLYNWDSIKHKIELCINRAAAEAHAEIKRMAVSARRSTGQRLRADYRARRK